MKANKTHSKACCSCKLGFLGRNSEMEGVRQDIDEHALRSTPEEWRGRKQDWAEEEVGLWCRTVKTSVDLSRGALDLGWVFRIVASWGEGAGPSPRPQPCCRLFGTGWSWRFSSAKAFSKEGWQLRVMAAFPEAGGVNPAFLKGHLDSAAQHLSLPNYRKDPESAWTGNTGHPQRDRNKNGIPEVSKSH